MSNQPLTEEQTAEQRQANDGQSPPESPPTPLDKPADIPLGTATGTIKLKITVEDDDASETPADEQESIDKSTWDNGPNPLKPSKTAKSGPDSDQKGEKAATVDEKPADPEPTVPTPPGPPDRPQAPLDALYIEIEEHVKRETELKAQLDALQQALDEALEMVASMDRNTLIEPLTQAALQHRLVRNPTEDELNQFSREGWHIDIQWVSVPNSNDKGRSQIVPCAHLTRQTAQAQLVGEATTGASIGGSAGPTFAIGQPVNSRIINDLVEMTPGELVMMTEGMPTSYRQQLMNAQLKHRALAHVGR